MPSEPRRISPVLVAVIEVVAVAALYIAVSIVVVRTVDLSGAFPEYWTAREAKVGSGFLVGAVVQVMLVLLGAYLLGLQNMRRAIQASLSPATVKGWTIALIATAIQILTAVLVVLPAPARIGEASSVNFFLSLIPAADGWSQEIVFRGYVIYRLAQAGVGEFSQILLSGALFAAIHVGYLGEGLWQATLPLAGTFMLGAFFAWAVQTARGSLKPVIICHAALIIVVQPWLALAAT